MSNQLPIRGIYDEWEREEVARRAQSDRLKDLFKRGKDEGYNPKALRQAFAERFALEHFTGEKLQKRERDASDVDLYLAALAGVRTREIIEEFDAETGEILDNSSTAALKASAPLPIIAETAGASGEIDGAAQMPSEPAGTQAPPVETIPEPETGAPSSPSVSEAGDESAVSSPAALVVAANTNVRHAYNPETHFANSDGLPRLHGCLKPDTCGGTWRALCFGCSVQHDGPSPQNGVA